MSLALDVFFPERQLQFRTSASMIMPTLHPHRGLGMPTTPIRPESINHCQKGQETAGDPAPMNFSFNLELLIAGFLGLGPSVPGSALTSHPHVCLRNATFPLSESKKQRKISLIHSRLQRTASSGKRFFLWHFDQTVCVFIHDGHSLPLLSP